MRDIFPNAIGYFGPGTQEFCSPGHLGDPSSQWDGRFFDPINSTERWETLAGPWVPFGHFEKAMDFFGDGSFWIIQAPGHMPGNLCACARLENGEWVLLGSDCCHSRSLLDGTHDFAEFLLPDGSRGCLHMDLPAAKATVARVKAMESDFGFHIALAHDASWMISDSNPVLASLIEPEFLRNAQRMCPKNAIL
ncbi:uncharacterized protein N7469_001094 [Penicillium citrinum]|uniref:Metallo-beta-lactamase domain-containing protein n=1 Tax=Penicillium citrinum TaxID=5077 RepID=A0A9W9TVA3_PENCI|nr:uncharacterized protein N7469_001094 [Penicillium citrinum]KAJ5242767.1 hypothetical protein N7469_001094 [Penicillium citrinum]